MLTAYIIFVVAAMGLFAAGCWLPALLAGAAAALVVAHKRRAPIRELQTRAAVVAYLWLVVR